MLHIPAMKPAEPQAAAAQGAPKSLNRQASPASNDSQEVDPHRGDTELVRRVQAGDQIAFRSLYDKYNRRVFAVALGVVKNQEDALDVVQEAFIKVHKHIGSFQGTSSFYTWLYRIAMNLAIDQVRKRRKVVELDDAIHKDDTASGGAFLPQTVHDNPSKTVSRRELSTEIQAALDTLPEYHRAVILLREVEDLSYEEMAKVLKVPKGTIMSRLFHARRKMQEQLRGYLQGDLEVKE
jgi:RNA polymerase sigma-70 factor (ECF subfamily)